MNITRIVWVGYEYYPNPTRKKKKKKKKKPNLSHRYYTLSGIKIRRVVMDNLSGEMREAITLSISHQILEQFKLLGNLGHV